MANIVNKNGTLDIPQQEYETLVERINNLWSESRNRAAIAVNTELLDANWQTGQYIVEFEQKGNLRAEYGKKLISRLAKDLTIRRGKGFSRSNLIYMRKLYICFPKSVTMSHLLTWSHYYELLKCEDELERQFYYKEAISQKWKVRELRRQIRSSLYQRLALSLGGITNQLFVARYQLYLPKKEELQAQLDKILKNRETL